MPGRSVSFEPSFSAQALFLWRSWECIDELMAPAVSMLASLPLPSTTGLQTLEVVRAQETVQLLFTISTCGRYVYLIGVAVMQMAA